MNRISRYKMKKKFLRLLTMLWIFSMAVSACNAQDRDTDLKHFQEGHSPREIGTRVARRFIATPHPNFGRKTPPRLITYPEVCTWYGALMFAEAGGNKALEKKLIARFQPFFSTEAPMVPPPDHVDHTVFGVLPLELYVLTGEKKYLAMGKTFADRQWGKPFGAHIFPHAYEYAGEGYTWQTRMWVDDMYMITAVETMAYRATGEKKYIDRAAKEMVLYLDSLQRPNGLFYHAPDVPFFWGRGNGWVAAGMTELLRSLPENDRRRPGIMAGYREMMAALLKCQTASGVWRQLLTDTAAWPETSGSGMFTYAMITGVKKGWLDKKIYGPAARKAWLGLIAYLDENAAMHNVCEGTNKKNSRQYYLDRKRNTGDMHGQAPVLWCAAALLR